MPQYLLAHHVFVCVQGEHVVFLDVRKDRYFALESARTAGLGSLVQGWPVSAPLAVDFIQQGAESTARVLAEHLTQAKAQDRCLCRQGDPTDSLLFIEAGRVSVMLERPGQAPLRVRVFGAHTIVGEVGFFLDAPRTAEPE